MRDLEFYRNMPDTDRFKVIKTLRADIRKLEDIKRDSDYPSDTVEKFRKAVGPERADATIASLINAYEDDGRICRTSINWAHRVDKAWAHDFMFDKCLYTGIHPAHLDQIAVTASKGAEYV